MRKRANTGRREKMSKLSKEETARYSGAEWALRLVEDHGLEAARAELESRGIRNIPLGLKQSDIDKFCEEEKANTVVTVMLMAAVTLRDEYDFGPQRIDRFIKRFNSKTEALLGKYVDWQELRDTLKEETGLEIELPEVFTDPKYNYN